MPFVPFKKAATQDAHVAPGAPAFAKKPAKRKQRKAAPAQKALMQSGRMTGGSR